MIEGGGSQLGVTRWPAVGKEVDERVGPRTEGKGLRVDGQMDG